MVSGIKDRLGENLAIGDLCVCYNSMRTGSSTTRLVQYEGEIIYKQIYKSKVCKLFL